MGCPGRPALQGGLEELVVATSGSHASERGVKRHNPMYLKGSHILLYTCTYRYDRIYVYIDIFRSRLIYVHDLSTVISGQLSPNGSWSITMSPGHRGYVIVSSLCENIVVQPGKFL